jgi:hypothetical protein
VRHDAGGGGALFGMDGQGDYAGCRFRASRGLVARRRPIPGANWRGNWGRSEAG